MTRNLVTGKHRYTILAMLMYATSVNYFDRSIRGVIEELSFIQSDNIEGVKENTEKQPWKDLSPKHKTWVFGVAKITNAVWWFYLFWGAKFLAHRFGVNIKDIALSFFVIYIFADADSVFGGIISHMLLGTVLDKAGNHGHFWILLIAGSSYLIILGIIHLMDPKMISLDDNLQPVYILK